MLHLRVVIIDLSVRYTGSSSHQLLVVIIIKHYSRCNVIKPYSATIVYGCWDVNIYADYSMTFFYLSWWRIDPSSLLLSLLSFVALVGPMDQILFSNQAT